MSDFLTNLLARSFSQTASVKPIMASPYAPPAEQRDTIEESADPFSEFPIVDEEVVREEIMAPPPQRPTVNRPPSPAAPIEDEPEPFLAPPERPRIADQTTRAIRHEVSQPPEPTTAASPSTGVNLDEPSAGLIAAKTSTPAPPEPPAPPVRKRSVRPKGTQAKPAPVAENAPTEGILQRRETSKAINADTARVAPPGVTEPSAPPPAKTTEIRTSRSERDKPLIVEHIVERTAAPLEQRQQAAPQFAALVPKPTLQSVLPLNVKLRPNIPAGDAPDEIENGLPQAETIVNVAIGRIEVRATPPATPGRERRRGPRVMSLDDYVQQRSRGTQ